MEILNWFLFFGIMIFLSFFTWFQIFGLFIVSILVINCFVNYPNIIEKTDISSLIQKTIVNTLKIVYNFVIKIISMLIYTSFGVFIYKRIMELEVAYQNSKGLIKQEAMKMILTSSTSRNFTPRVSLDDEDTDDES